MSLAASWPRMTSISPALARSAPHAAPLKSPPSPPLLRESTVTVTATPSRRAIPHFKPPQRHDVQIQLQHQLNTMRKSCHDDDGGHRRQQQYSDDNNTAMTTTMTEQHP
ncbi:hypothetical protein EDB85DRAFT_2143945 [Lactarius pseudohatsudake]|nr:hypothetical protein EDB85DRAFT_2143945 [Lactarius pseudohatsudake]